MEVEPAAPLVSVIVRSMGRPSLASALASIAAQSYPRIEVVIVGASGPAHPAPATQCGVHAVRFVASAVPLRRPDAANAGLDAAAGEWITFVDDDDRILVEHVAGLVAARGEDPGARVIHSLARAVFANGTVETFGQRCSLLQLYERNFIHLSTVLFSCSLLDEGCRFDPSLDIHEDWDFMLQLAQRTRFRFTPRQTFEWHADAGDSGAGGGRNQDAARFAQFRDQVYAKWTGHHDALLARVQALLQRAGSAAQRGDHADAAAACREVLAVSPNDPWGLNMLAMVERAAGRLAEAAEAQRRAVEVRPQDPDLIYNLALLCRDLGDADGASEHCRRALVLAPDNVRYRGLAAALATTPIVRH